MNTIEISQNLRRFGEINTQLNELDAMLANIDEPSLHYNSYESRELARRFGQAGREILSFAENLRSMPEHYLELANHLIERYEAIHTELRDNSGTNGFLNALYNALVQSSGRGVA